MTLYVQDFGSLPAKILRTNLTLDSIMQPDLKSVVAMNLQLQINKVILIESYD